MGIFGRLFGRGKSKESGPPTPTCPTSQHVGATPSNLLEYLDESEGTDELYELLRTRSADEIAEVCRAFPIESLRLDWGSIEHDFRNSRRFELITALAQILVGYEEILKQSPELRLPASLPAQELGDTLMSRLMPFIGSQETVEIAHSLRIRLYDFAMALMQAGRDGDALTCLLAGRPSIKEDHEFWICACRFNVAQTTKNPDDIAAAIESAEQILRGDMTVPDQYLEGAKHMLSTLREQD